MNNVLVVAPHSDDETIGCGASINKLVGEGKKVYVLIATNAHVGAPDMYSEERVAKVRGEARAAHAVLGVTETLFLDFPAPALDMYPIYKMAKGIGEVIREKNIDTVFMPYRGDIHIDHQRVYDATLVACRPKGKYSVKNVFCYETLSETEWASPVPQSGFIPNFYIPVSEKNVEAKLKAIACFTTQCNPFPDSRSVEAIEALAKYRGATISRLRAEAFFSVRQILE